MGYAISPIVEAIVRDDKNTSEVLDLMAVPEWSGIYVLGCFAINNNPYTDGSVLLPLLRKRSPARLQLTANLPARYTFPPAGEILEAPRTVKERR